MKNNTNKKENLMKNENTMNMLNDNFYNTMNKVDSQLSEINKILTSFNSTLNVEDLLVNVYENIENNIVEQIKSKKQI